MSQLTNLKMGLPIVPPPLVAAIVCQILRGLGHSKFKINKNGDLFYMGDPDELKRTQYLVELHFKGVMCYMGEAYKAYVIENNLASAPKIQ